MIHKNPLVGLTAIALLLSGLTATLAGAAAAKDPDSSSAALAERFYDFAQSAVPQKQPAPQHQQQMAALLEAAWRLNPDEPRFAHPLASELIRHRKLERALEVLNALRKDHPEDRIAQIQVIDIHLAGMQTADRQLEYLRNVLAAQSVPPEVRSVAAMRAAALLDQRNRPEEASQLVEQALKLNPVNVAALGAKYSALPANAAPAVRLELELSLLLANPAQPQRLLRVARTASAVGLVEDSLKWYEQTLAAASRSGEIPVLYAAVLESAAQQILAGRFDVAIGYLSSVIAQRPDDSPPLVLALLAQEQKGNKDQADKLRVQAGNVLFNQLQTVRAEMGIKPAATRPVTEAPGALPDLSGDVEAFKKAPPGVQAKHLQMLGELAWFEAFFNRQPEPADKLLKTLMQFSDAADESARISPEFAARMQGWLFLLRGKMDEAKVKLSAAEKNDAMAALGMVRVLAASDKAAAKAAAQQLLNRCPSGMTGVLISQALQEHGVKVEPTADAAPIRPLLAKFPMEWLKVITNPMMFYSVRGEPTRISVPFGYPMLASITVQNNSDYDLTIGEQGILKPQLLLDVQTGGVMRQQVPAAVVASIPEQLVLKPRQKVTFLVRIDQGQVHGLLTANPTAPVGIMVTLRSNALIVPGRGILAGPAGQVSEFRRMMERSPFVLSEETYRGLIEGVGSGRGAERIRALQLLHELTMGLLRSAGELKDPDRQKDARVRADALMTLCRKAWFDANPDVKAYAAYFYALESQDGPQMLEEMLADAAWQARLLGLLAMQHRNAGGGEPLVPADQQKVMVKALLEKEKEPQVRDYAAAVLELLNGPAPATRPAPRG